MDTRLLLISHASTAAMRAGCFPADDPLDARGLAEAGAAHARLSIPDDAAVFVSPAVCARDTASALGKGASVDEGLADMDYGLWHGRRLADLAVEAPQDLAAWTHDPDAAAHGGESFSQLVKRVGQWLDALNDALSEGVIRATDSASNDGTNEAKNRKLSEKTSVIPSNTQNVVAVTHASVIRAAIVHALGASPAVFPRIEIAPLSMVELRRSRRGWTWWPASQ
ncbi:histidine phosphatase family protein [Paraburkholderia sediminicola]|uniref:histidine phosphatase family protein n=1 Tax=Paraburkholderia sediminicola TaxID=458836 RepID=UPI0038BB322C